MEECTKYSELFKTALEKLDVKIHLNSEVTEIIKKGKEVKGVKINTGSTFYADAVISNMETIPAYKQLLAESDRFLYGLKRFEPSCSGLVIDIGVNRKYDCLAHHNFFYSVDQRNHFKSVFKKKMLPDDPTIYLVASSRTDFNVAPEGHEALKILPHIPHINKKNPYTVADYLKYKDIVLGKLEKMGLDNLRENIVFEHILTPFDIKSKYYSNCGSIYGVVCDRWKNFALKTPKKSTKYNNLFFVGGSVNPGSGMPMVVLGGQKTGEIVTKYLNS